MPATERLRIDSLREADIESLVSALWDERVYRHIGGLPRAPELVALGLSRALAGPPVTRPTERWLNYGMRLIGNGELIGRLEATVHDGIAEVAFLLSSKHWGAGYASEGLQWLHRQLERISPGMPCWATTLPANTRSRRLLERCGYLCMEAVAAPWLMTYDEGDLVFRRDAGAPAPVMA